MTKYPLRSLKDPEKAKASSRFFKTGPGQYGEGDSFLGITVPIVRKVANGLIDISGRQLEEHLESPFHEERLLGLLILVARYEKAQTLKAKKKIFDFYLKKRRHINNWDLVDVTVAKILGDFTWKTQNRSPLVRLSKSKRHWDRRMAVVGTYAWIRNNNCDLTYEFCVNLLKDREDLMHKACGWMLREAGKRDGARLEHFIEEFGLKMPRTMLRYAIEKFPERKRKEILARR